MIETGVILILKFKTLDFQSPVSLYIFFKPKMTFDGLVTSLYV